MNLGGADVQWSVPSTGNYKVTVNTNTLAISIATNTATSVSTANQEYPSLLSNVVSDELKVENSSNLNYHIFNVAGASVLSGNSENGIIPVSTLNKGIYLLKAENKTFKFVKN